MKSKLSPTKMKVLTLLAQGYSDKEISIKLQMSVRTAQTHISSIISKLNARNRTNAVAIYMHNHPNCNIL